MGKAEGDPQFVAWILANNGATQEDKTQHKAGRGGWIQLQRV